MSHRPNFYVLLELDSAQADLGRIEQAISGKRAQWSADRNHPLRGRQAQQNLEMIAEMQTLLSDPSRRAEEAAEAGRLRDLFRKELDEAVSIPAAKGHLVESEVALLVQTFKGRLEEQEIRQRLKVPIQPDPAATPSDPSIPASILRHMDDLLESIGKRDLYHFLEIDRIAALAVVQERSREIDAETRRINTKTAEVTTRSELAGYCLGYFKDTETRRQYDAAVDGQALRRFLDPLIELAGASGEIHAAVFNQLLEKTRAKSFATDEVREYIKSFARRRKWTVELDDGSRENTTKPSGSGAIDPRPTPTPALVVTPSPPGEPWWISAWAAAKAHPVAGAVEQGCLDAWSWVKTHPGPVAIGLLVIAGLLYSTFWSSERRAWDFYRNAQVQAGDLIANYDAAIELYDKAIKLLPHPDFYHAKGQAHAAKRDYLRAAAAYADALRHKRADTKVSLIESDHAIASWKVGTASFGRTDYQQAIVHLSDAARLGTKLGRIHRRDIHHDLGRAYLEVNKPDDAVTPLLKAIEIGPDDPAMYHALSLARLRQRQYALAIKDATRAIALIAEPGFANPLGAAATTRRAHYHEIRGLAHGALGHWSEAAADYQQRVDLAPDDWEPWGNLAILLLQLNDVFGYQRLRTRMLEKFKNTSSPEHANAAAWVAALAPTVDVLPTWKQTARQLAERAVAEAQRQNSPRLFLYHGTLAWVHFRLGNYKTSLEQSRKKQALQKKDDVRDWLLLAKVHHSLGEADKARDWLRQAVAWLDKHGEQQTWTFRLEVQLLRREAEGLIGPNPPPTRPGIPLVPLPGGMKKSGLPMLPSNP